MLATYSNEGWNATIMPVDLLTDMDTAKVHVNVTSVPDAAITTKSDTICLGQEAVVMASAELAYPQYYVWYNSNMEVLKRDTLLSAETPQSMLELPAHFNGASYYALIYSDTVSCVMNTNTQQRVLSIMVLSCWMRTLRAVPPCSRPMV